MVDDRARGLMAGLTVGNLQGIPERWRQRGPKSGPGASGWGSALTGWPPLPGNGHRRQPD